MRVILWRTAGVFVTAGQYSDYGLMVDAGIERIL